ncbi:MAG TPA: hypothetical protein VNI01_02340, partial [Elusimicrobiota bacterium]|nr:hypothetical protein [Elusimicrobiota bacterium]
LVRAFAVERRLVVYGGLAIDFALRLRGERLYPDGARPDFDFFSPRSVDDAYDLADRLAAAGLPAVSAIRAVHVQTTRVRVAFRVVADLSFAPPAVFAELPVFEYAGLRTLHPDFQRMDIHLSLCFPFAGAPREAVFHRWRKDLKRFALLARLYPLAAPAAAPAAPEAPEAVPLVEVEAGLAVAGKAPELQVALHGFAAYAALRVALAALARARGQPDFPPGEAGAPMLALEFVGAGRLRVGVPAGGEVHLASFEPEAAAGAGAAAFEPFMDLAPPSFRRGPLTVFSTRGRRLAAAIVPVAAGGAALQAWVVSPQALLLLFLLRAHRAPGERATWLAFYRHTLALLRRAEALCAGGGRELLARSPFALAVRTFGPAETDPAYLVRMAELAAALGETAPPPATGLPPDLAGLLAGLPKNYYPGRKRRPAFDYGASAFFRRAGAPGRPAAGSPTEAGA